MKYDNTKLIYKVEDAIAKVSHNLHHARVNQRVFWTLECIHGNGKEFSHCTLLTHLLYDLECWRESYMANVVYNGNYDPKPKLPRWTEGRHTDPSIDLRDDPRPKALIIIDELIRSISEWEGNAYQSGLTFYEVKSDYTFIKSVIEAMAYQERGDIVLTDLTRFIDEDTPAELAAE